MRTKTLPRLGVAALTGLALASCSSSAGSDSGDSHAARDTTPGGAAAPASDTVCPALADVQTSAATLKSDLESRKFSTLSADISNLDTALKTLTAAMSSPSSALAICA